jgi:hypothetical protein
MRGSESSRWVAISRAFLGVPVRVPALSLLGVMVLSFFGVMVLSVFGAMALSFFGVIARSCFRPDAVSASFFPAS